MMQYLLKIGCLLLAGLISTVSYSHHSSHFSWGEHQENCINRDDDKIKLVVDSHFHFKSFGGDSLSFENIVKYLGAAGVEYVNAYGIGLSAKRDAICVNGIECSGEYLLPSMEADFDRIGRYIESKRDRKISVKIVMSMTFPDLTRPDNIFEVIKIYETKFPGLFRWVGEINLVNQSYGEYSSFESNKADLDAIEPAMNYLFEKRMPITIHSDLGIEQKPFLFSDQLERLLNRYPNNRFVWAHMGVSEFVLDMNAFEHVALVSAYLNTYPNLMIDLSSEILWKNYLLRPLYQNLYIDFINTYSDRVFLGTDFVASKDSTLAEYQATVDLVSRFNRYYTDSAYTNIVLGKNYFNLLGIHKTLPKLCYSD